MPDVGSDQVWQWLADATPDALLLVDSAGLIRYANPYAHRVFGYGPDTLLGRTIEELVPTELRARHAAHRCEYHRHPSMRELGTRNIALTGLRADGSQFPAEIHLAPLASATDSFTMAVVRDVTAHRQIEAELRDGEQRIRAILDAAFEFIGLLKPDGTLLEANRTALEFVGAAAAEVVGQPFWETPWWRDDVAQQERLRRAIVDASQGQFVRFEARHRRKGGTIDAIDFSITPRFGDRARVALLVVEGRRITELTQAQKALRESNERFSLAMRGTNDGIWDWNIATGEDYFSDRYLELLGYAPGEIECRYQEWESRLHPEERAHVLQCLKEHLEGRRPWNIEYRIRTKSGDFRWFLARGQAIWDANGKPLRMAGSITDIAERKQTETALRDAKQQAESATRAKSRFLAVASHDLRQPLQAAALLSAAASRLAREPELHSMLEQQRQALVSATHLLNAILDLTKLESGAIQPNMAAISLAEIFDALRSELKHVAHEKQLRLAIAAPPIAVRSDATWLRQILQNLLTNALRYTPCGGEVSMQAYAADGNVTIEVRDTGRGIAAEELAHIFDEFYQAPSAAKDRKGWGLGLSIVRHAAAMLKHEIRVESQVGRGTTFCVRLEQAHLATTPKRISAPNEAERSPLAARGRVLLIEDDQAVIGATKLLLNVEGFDVYTASDRHELQNLLRTPDFSVDAIVSDLHLGEGDSGPELVRLVRHSLRRVVPAIVVSGDTHQPLGTADKADELERLTKPIDAELLVQKLDQLLQHSMH